MQKKNLKLNSSRLKNCENIQSRYFLLRCAGHEVEYNVHGVRFVSLCPFGVVTPMQDFEVYTGMTKQGQDFLTSLDVKGRLCTMAL